MHSTLQPRTNLWLIALWLTVAIVVGYFFRPVPWQMYALGGLLGAIAGLAQLKALQESFALLLTSLSAMDVRRALASCRFGRLYLQMFWVSFVLLLGLAYYLLGSRFPIGWVAGYSTFACIRELLTLRGTFELRRLALQQS